MGDLAGYVTDPLQYEFMRRALIAVILMGAVTGAIGTYIVLRGLSFIGDALAHAIFPGIVIAFLIGQSIFLGALIFGVLTSGAIAVVATNRRVKEDSAIGVLFAGTFALGVVLISSTKNDSDKAIMRSFSFVALENSASPSADLTSVMVQDSLTP